MNNHPNRHVTTPKTTPTNLTTPTTTTNLTTTLTTTTSNNRSMSDTDSQFDEFHSPLRSPLPTSPTSKAIVAVDNNNNNNNKYYTTSFRSPTSTHHKPPQTGVAKLNNDVENNNNNSNGGGVGERRVRKGKGGVVEKVEVGVRVVEMVVSLIAFSVMAADKTQGWSGDSFDRYREYRFVVAVNAIAFAYAAFQAIDMTYHLIYGNHIISYSLSALFNFLIDQILAYLLISASSSAATRVDDWVSNWGKDDFTEMATASIGMSFVAFFAFAVSSVISGYNLCNRKSL